MNRHLEILKQQETMLQFESFDHEQAYQLGCFMVDYAKRNQIIAAVSIRMNNGCIVFQHCPDGTNLLNQKWMDRKFCTVKCMERSSLLTTFAWEEDGCDAKTHALEESEYALCGGGFPIRIRGSQVVIGAIIVSNLYHVADHEFIVACLKEYLHCPQAPVYPYQLP